MLLISKVWDILWMYQCFYEIYVIVHDFYLQSMFRIKKVSSLLTVPIRTTIRKMSSADLSPWQEEKGNTITELDKMLDVFFAYQCLYIYQILSVIHWTLSERLSKLPLEERRENYYCGPKEFQELKDIPTWQEHFIKNKKSLSEKG